MQAAPRHLVYVVSAVLATAAIAWIALQVQQDGFAPVVLFPLAVGGALGAALVGIERFAQSPPRRLAVAAAVVWGLLAVLAQDYIAHRYRLRQYEAQLADNPLAAAVADEGDMRPDFFDHLTTTVRGAALWWVLDLVLTATAATATVALAPRLFAGRQPPAPGAGPAAD